MCKFYDANNNKQFDGAEALPNWMLTLDPLGSNTPFTTGAVVPTGCKDFTFPAPGQHTVQECLAAPYTQTAAIVDGSAVATATSVNVNVTGTNEVDFGNNCPFQAGNCRDNGVASNCTIGFYKNNCSQVSSSCSSNTINLGSGGICQVSVTGCTQIAAIEISRGPLPVEEALRYSIQIADALALAHRQVIHHRDLKPGNIMLTKAGAKLLDPGLCRCPGRAVAAVGGGSLAA